MKHKQLLYMSCLFLVCMLASSAVFADEFPLRKDFPELKPISTEQLAEKYSAGEVIVVDVRSQFEYETIHVKDAKNVPLAKRSFAKDLEAVRGKDDVTALVFYCNGITCAKSYRGAKKAQEAGFKNCFVYDAGIFTWTKTHPEWSSLLNQTPADPGKLISKSALKAKTLSFEEFKAKTSSAKSVVIDIRDPLQRKVRLDLAKERNIPLDRFENLLKRGDMKEKDLLIYDAVGKQVRWLMYHLEQNGYTNYAFLSGGVRKAIGDTKHF